MPGFVRNLAAAVLASGLACSKSCWAQQSTNTNLPLVWVLSTGGTIAGAGASPTNVQEYKGGTILGEALVEAVPETGRHDGNFIISIRSETGCGPLQSHGNWPCHRP